MVICSKCKKNRQHKAKGLCKPCYDSSRKRKRKHRKYPSYIKTRYLKHFKVICPKCNQEGVLFEVWRENTKLGTEHKARWVVSHQSTHYL